ncbi:MAG: IS200/IS605 family transposase [Woronichinia naegeliana WA131]|uniref:IS200/IS605 family transposase n=1 Tax=Woronichinia naegeliana WA131 TaxID=2824559 RepID=A0A977KXX5_9CYAN|nr:MAG: IS200/IS605 family transposase [Woronichinia naegeliana WA131]
MVSIVLLFFHFYSFFHFLDPFRQSFFCSAARCKFIEIGVDKDHVHFLVQSVPTYSVTKLVKMSKSLTAKEVFRRCPQVKQKLWGGEFWSDGYFASTVGKHGDEGMIAKYVKNQGKEYLKLHRNEQLTLF